MQKAKSPNGAGGALPGGDAKPKAPKTPCNEPGGCGGRGPGGPGGAGGNAGGSGGRRRRRLQSAENSGSGSLGFGASRALGRDAGPGKASPPSDAATLARLDAFAAGREVLAFEGPWVHAKVIHFAAWPNKVSCRGEYTRDSHVWQPRKHAATKALPRAVASPSFLAPVFWLSSEFTRFPAHCRGSAC